MLKQIRYRALIARLRTKQDSLVKIQSLVRGHLYRVLNKQKVAKIKRDGMKGTRKWKSTVKI